MLGLAAGVYPGFALSGSSADERVLQWGVAIAFAFVATLGIAVSPWWLPAGWILHAAWDALHHAARRGSWVPGHYPMFCLSFDLVLAAWSAALAAAGPS